MDRTALAQFWANGSEGEAFTQADPDACTDERQDDYWTSKHWPEVVSYTLPLISGDVELWPEPNLETTPSGWDPKYSSLQQILHGPARMFYLHPVSSDCSYYKAIPIKAGLHQAIEIESTEPELDRLLGSKNQWSAYKQNLYPRFANLGCASKAVATKQQRETASETKQQRETLSPRVPTHAPSPSPVRKGTSRRRRGAITQAAAGQLALDRFSTFVTQLQNGEIDVTTEAKIHQVIDEG
jgi:hypothetical protein